MAYYVGTLEFPSLTAATDYIRSSGGGGTVTSEPVGTSDGMLTKPAPTTKETGPVGTTTSDPTKTQPGETGPFDPDGGPVGGTTEETGTDTPAPAPEPEPEPEGVTTFTFFRGVELGDANPNALYNRGEATQVTQAELQEYFNEEGSGMLREAFGDFNNYLAYMTEREQLIQSGDYDVGNWDEYTGSLTEDELMILEGEDLTQYSDSDQDVYTEAYGQRMQEQSSAYDRWINSDENQALLSKYGVNSIFYNSDGDKYEWNGSAYVKTVKQEQMGVGDYVKAGIVAAMGYYMGGALSEFFAAPTTVPAGSGQVAGLGWNSSIATGAAQGIANAATQLVMTGDVDFGEALESAITAGLGAEALKQIRETGILDQLVDSVMEYTSEQRWISLEDGTLFKLVNEYDAEGNLIDTFNRVLMPNGGTLSVENFLQFASEGAFGSPVLRDSVGLVVEFWREGLQTPEFLDNIIEAATNAYTTQGSVTQSVVNFLAGSATSGSGTGPMGAVVSGDLNTTADGLTVLNQLRELLEITTDPDARADIERQIEAYEQEVEEPETTEPEEDILTDTTQEATGLEEDQPGITEEMFQDVVDQVREDGIVQTQEIIDAINALGVADLPTLEQIRNAFPELNDVSLEQIESTVSQLLTDAGLLTTDQFTEAMAGVLTPEQLAAALANLPYGTPEDFIEAISNANIASPEDIINALNNADLITNEQFTSFMEEFRTGVVGDISDLIDEALANFPFPEGFTEEQIQQLRDAIVIPEGATMEQIQAALDSLVDRLPEAPTIDEMRNLFNEELSRLDIASPQDVRDALAEFNFSEEQIAQIINALPEGLTVADLGTALEGVVVGEDLDAAVTTITDAISGLNIASPDDIREILANYGFTQEQLNQIAGAINIPPSATVADVERIIAGIPPGLSVEEITSALGSEFNALAEGISGVQAGVDDLAEQLGLTSNELINAINVLSTKSSDELTETERNILTGLTGLADSFNTDLSSVVGSISGLSEDVVSGITTLGGQIETGFANVQEGIDGLANQLGISTEQLISVLEGLEGRTTDQLSDLETSVISGLAGLGTSFGVGINGVLESITGLSTDVVSGISDLSGQLTGVQSGIDALADQLGLTRDEFLNAITNLSVKTSDQLTDIDRSIIDGLSGLATSFNTDITGVVSSITGLGADVASGISGISSQISGLETAVTTGIEDLADQLNVSTDEIVSAVISIGSGLGGELTDLETSVLRGLGSLADVLGTDIESVVGSIGGLGSDVVEGFAGISGELQTGFGQLGQQLGLLTAGLFGLSAKQPTAQQIAAAQPFEFKPFEETASPRQVQQIVQTQPVKQQPSALQQINNLINRQTATPQIQPINQGMFTSDPNRKLA